MAEPQQEFDRNEPATPFKLEEAKKRGQVAKSTEFNSFFLLAGVLLVLYFSGEYMFKGQLRLNEYLFHQAGRLSLNNTSVVALTKDIFLNLLWIYWPLLLVVIVAGILANMAQTGPILSFFPIKPDWNRLNPVTGFKRVFSQKMFFEFIKTIIKLILFTATLYFSIVAVAPLLFGLLDTQPGVQAEVMLTESLLVLFKLVLVFLIIAALDLINVKKEYAKKMRMSHREIREEVKRREGDPHVRARIRELQKEAAKRAGSLQNIPGADVVITNPTHIAVAILYQREMMTAPKIISKGAGELALKIREIAAKYNVPLVENKSLARRLFKEAEIGASIPMECFASVAKILVKVYALRRLHSGNLTKI